MPLLTIRMRLALLYALPLIAGLGVGATSLARLSNVRRLLQIAAEENSAAMQLAAAGLAHASETSRLMHEALLEPDPRRALVILNSVETNRERAHRIDDSIRGVLRSKEGQTAFRPVETACDDFGSAFRRFSDLIVADHREEAAAVMRADILPQRRRVQAAWQDFIGWHRSEIQSASTAAAEAYSRGRREIIAAIVIALGTGIAAGVFGTASVVRPVSGAVRIAQQVARGDLRDKIVVTRADELGSLQAAMATTSDRLEAVLAQVRHGAHEVANASEDIRANARWLLEHTSVQSSGASEIVATLHQMGSASARTLDLTREIRRTFDAEEPSDDPRGGSADLKVVRLPLSSGATACPLALLDTAEKALGELWAGVARVNRTVLSVDSIARDNAMRAQDLWCTAEALSRRAAALERTVGFFHVREPRALESPVANNQAGDACGG